MSKVALITGITGQDGSYLAEFLLEKGYEVHGIVRRASISNTARIDHLIEKNVIKLHDGDLSDSSGLIRLVGEIRPDEIYNLAAQSHVQVSFDAPEYSGDVDALGVLRVLEAVRVCGLTKTCKVYQASTSELYGKVEEVPQKETTPLKYCEFLNRQYGTDYISVMPTNLYGPNDNYHPTHSHVLPALIRRFHEAKESGAASVTCWGDGSPLREFLYVDDLANLCVFLMNNYSGNETVNAGTGKELTIKELTELVAKVVGYNGEIKWDPDKPNGTPRKLLDVSKATNLGWTYKTELEEGIRLAYEDFLNNPMRAER